MSMIKAQRRPGRLLTTPRLGPGVLTLLLAVGSVSAGSCRAQDAEAGHALFIRKCSACHQATGLGVKGAFPALKGDVLVQGDPGIAVATVLKGRGGMPTFASVLKDTEIADILTYVRGAWGNAASAITSDFVAEVRQGITAADTRPKGN